jgi:hypothetical protein
VPYKPQDSRTVEQLLQPTPARLATAKAWVAERLQRNGAIGPGLAVEFAQEQGLEDPGRGGSGDPADPVSQAAQIAWWQWVLPFRVAIYEMHRGGVIVPRHYGNPPDNALKLFDVSGPEIPLGDEGTRPGRHPFPTVVLYSGYMLANANAIANERRLELYDADLYLNRADLRNFDRRVQQCVEEALAAFRNDLFLAAANMLGAASEGAWYSIAHAVVDAEWASTALANEVASQNPRAEKIQGQTRASLENRFTGSAAFEGTFGFPRSELETLEAKARHWREQRNWGAHPVGPVDVSAFTESSVGEQLIGATTYFARLAALLRGARTANEQRA